MSARRYYHDSYTVEFEATVVEVAEVAQGHSAVLDGTYFYPTSGGQPNDLGRLEQGPSRAQVKDVVIREDDGVILHMVDRPLSPGAVRGEIDWSRRFDHMQHHTGQHILTQAFLRVAEAETVGFHLSAQSVTIDLDRAGLTAAEIAGAESLANAVVWDNRPVSARIVSRVEAGSLALRKIPAGVDGDLRVIEVADFDLTACGGTHVARTGEIGLIKVVKVERRNDLSRVEFCCGRRALDDYRGRLEATQALSSALTTGIDDLLASVTKLQEESRDSRRRLKQQQAAILGIELGELLARAEAIGGVRLVRAAYAGRDAEELRELGSLLAGQDGVVGLLGTAGSPSQFVFVRSANAPGDMGALLKLALAEIGGRGGGRPQMAQGGGIAAGVDVVDRALARAESLWRESL